MVVIYEGEEAAEITVTIGEVLIAREAPDDDDDQTDDEGDKSKKSKSTFGFSSGSLVGKEQLWGKRGSPGRLFFSRFLPIAYCLLPIAYCLLPIGV